MLEELKEANEYISSKIDKYKSSNLELIKEIEKDAEINNVPIISKEIREYLKFIIRTNKNIKNILEIGTATGYSGIIMSEEIEKINKNFDFIFIDAAKGQYKKFFEDSYKLLNECGIVFVDNILFRGYLYKESPKRFKTIVKRLDEFVNYLYENFDFVLLPISDGVGIIHKPF